MTSLLIIGVLLVIITDVLVESNLDLAVSKAIKSTILAIVMGLIELHHVGYVSKQVGQLVLRNVSTSQAQETLAYLSTQRSELQASQNDSANYQWPTIRQSLGHISVILACTYLTWEIEAYQCFIHDSASQ